MKHLYSALLCIVVHPKRFTIIWGGLSSTTTSVQHPLGWCDGSHRTTAPVRSPHTSYRWRGERDRANQVDVNRSSFHIYLKHKINMNEHQKVSCFICGKMSTHTIFKFKSTDIIYSYVWFVCWKKWQIWQNDWSGCMSVKLLTKGELIFTPSIFCLVIMNASLFVCLFLISF